MKIDQDRTFRPGLEALEGRALPTSFFISALRPTPLATILAAAAHAGTAASTGTHTPAMVHTLVNPVSPVTGSVSVVPQHISFGLSDQPSSITITGSDPGFNTSGLPGSNSVSSTGLTTAGLPQYPPSQLPAQAPLYNHMITLNSDGSVSGGLW